MFIKRLLMHANFALFALNAAIFAVTFSIPPALIGLFNLGVGIWIARDVQRFNDLRKLFPKFVPDKVVLDVLRDIPKDAKLGGVGIVDEDGNVLHTQSTDGGPIPDELLNRRSPYKHDSGLAARKRSLRSSGDKRRLARITKHDG